MEASFQTSQPLRRSTFVSLCRETSQLSQLLFAPLGLPAVVENLELPLEEEFAALYRQWEDVLSLHMYNLRQVAADRVAASMHHYIEVKKDEVVMSAIRRETMAFAELVEPPAVVELPSSNEDVDLASADVAAKLVSQVLNALSTVANCSSKAAATSKYWVQKYGMDTAVWEALGIEVPRKQFSPSDIAPLLTAASTSASASASSSSSPSSSSSSSPAATTPALLRKLLQALDGALKVSVGSTSAPSLVSFSVQQYHALLRLHSSSPQVLAVLTEHLPEKLKGGDACPLGMTLLDVYQVALYCHHGDGPWAGLGLGVSPLLSMTQQLECALNASPGDVKGGDKSRLKRFQASYAAIKTALNKQRRARTLFQMAKDGADDQEQEGQEEGYLEAIKAAIEGEEEEENWETDDGEDDEEEEEEEESDEEEDEEGSKPAMPSSLLASLLADRAEYTAGSYQFDYSDPRTPQQRALEDVQRALSLDPYSSKAYALRSQLASEAGARLQDRGDEDEDDDDEDDDEDDQEDDQEGDQEEGEEKSKKPHGSESNGAAAKDALAAFLIGGSADLALAAEAEETLRRVCKSAAREIFLSRELSSSSVESEEQEGKGWTLPKGWQVQAYFSGFDLPSVGLEAAACKKLPGGDAVLEMVAIIEKGLLDEGSQCLSAPAASSSEPSNGTGEDERKDDEEEEEEDVGEREVYAVVDGGNWEPPSGQHCSLLLHACIAARPSPAATALATATATTATTTTTTTTEDAASTPGGSATVGALLALLQRPDVAALSGVSFSRNRVSVPAALASYDDELRSFLEGVHDDEGEGGWHSEAETAAGNNAVRARLLNMAGSVAFLLGHTTSAVLCFVQSLRASPLADSCVKLAALLNDMDDAPRAHALFNRAEALLSRSGRAGAGRGRVYCLLHMAELAANLTDFDEAVSLLGQAKRINDSFAGQKDNDNGDDDDDDEEEEEDEDEDEDEEEKSEGETTNNDEGKGVARKDKGALRSLHYSQLRYTVITLLGVTVFRLAPNAPESALNILKPACAEAEADRTKGKGSPGLVYLLLCMGEVLAQCGDLTGSLDCFRRASAMYPSHPLPFVNAARTYQQLNQRGLSSAHVQRAVALDPSFPLPHVDLAQALLYQGKVDACQESLQRALALARHGESPFSFFLSLYL